MRGWIDLLTNLNESQDDFIHVLADANSHGATITAEFWAQDRQVFIEYIHGGGGSGAKALRTVLNYCDAHDYECVLSVLDAAPGLINYYHRFGFKVDGVSDDEYTQWFLEFENTWDFDTNDEEVSMTRKPEKAA